MDRSQVGERVIITGVHVINGVGTWLPADVADTGMSAHDERHCARRPVGR